MALGSWQGGPGGLGKLLLWRQEMGSGSGLSVLLCGQCIQPSIPASALFHKGCLLPASSLSAAQIVPCMTQQLRLCIGTPRGSLGRFLMTIQCPPLCAAWPRSTCPSTCVHLHLYLYPYICTKCDKGPQVMLGHLPTCSVCHNYAQLNMGPHLDQPIWFRASLT